MNEFITQLMFDLNLYAIRSKEFTLIKSNRIDFAIIYREGKLYCYRYPLNWDGDKVERYRPSSYLRY